jgi:hypothetical protein
VSPADQTPETQPRARRATPPEPPRLRLVVGGAGPRTSITRVERRQRRALLGLRLLRGGR